MQESSHQPPRKVLILAPIGRDGAVVRHILVGAGFEGEVCQDVAGLLAGLSEAAAAVIAEEAFRDARDVEAVRRWLEAQPAWSDFPFVLLSLRTNDADERRAALRDALGNITLLERPLRPDTVVRATRASARARQRQLEAARLLEERARAEAERRAGEERLRELFENAADAIFIAAADRRLTDVNPAACNLLGYRREELLGRSGGIPLVEDDKRPFEDWMVTQVDGRSLASEWRLRCKDGSAIDVEITARVLADGRWQAFARDISDRKRAEAELRRLNETLEARVLERTTELSEAQGALAQAQKMEAVGQLTGGVAHDFNNLLMAISGGLDMLFRHDDPERRQRVMDGMRQAVDRGAALTRQLLTFARRQALEPEPLLLHQQIGAMGELLARSLRGDIEVTMEFAPDLWAVDVDPTQLEVAVLNLAVNARDAMPDGGVLSIRAENAPALALEEIAGDFVRLSVSDTGTGMAPEVIARVFEPFFTTKDIGKGSGLGLAQIYGFAKQSGGIVQIDSAVGAGTTVTILLPRAERSVAAAGAAEFGRSAAPPPDGPAAGASVLLVEDDDEVAALVADMIGQLGYRVTRVANAAAALGALADGRRIDIVFSDILMPGGLDGTKLAREIGRRRPGLPIVLTTGYDGQSLSTAAELGLPVLRKPYRMETLGHTLASALHRPERAQRCADTTGEARSEGTPG
ncbi:PAS domain S-box protein [Faunimonas sp. B44]|uniref:PAS domain S-box protein n=1 Tax=Faunimonas sp. B44 TaxID=3461493 RepID=UPI004044126B